MAEGWSRERIEARIRLEAIRQGVDPNLAVAVATQESSLRHDNPGDRGKSRGVFHMQRAAAIDAGIDPAMRDDPETGIVGGVRYLKQQLTKSKGNVEQALSRFNRGTPEYRGIGDPDYIYHVLRHYPGHQRGLAPDNPAGYAARLNKTFGAGTATEERQGRPRDTFAGTQFAAAGGDTLSDMPRYQGKGAEAKTAKPWVDILPDTPPEAAPTQRQAPTQGQAPTQAAPVSARPWVDVLPDTPPESPPQSSTRPPATAPLSGEPPAGTVAPTRQSEAPTAPAPTTHEQRMAERPWYQKVWGTPSDPDAPDKVPPSTTLSPGYVEPGLEEQNPAREWTATGIELGSGILGSTLGAAGGPAGIVAGGAAGQSYGHRLNLRLGLRDEEAPLLEGGDSPWLKLYPSDVLNVGLGVLTEAVPLAKQVLGKTKAGQAILSAEAETKAAFQAWKEADEAATAAQQKGQTKAWEEAMGKARIKRMEYENRVKARGETIKANQAEYDAAEAEWKQEGRTQILREEGDQKLYERTVADARTREYGAARRALAQTQEEYAAEVAATDAATQAKAAGKQAEVQSAEQGQQGALREAQQLPYSIKTGDKPGWQLYDEWRAGARDVQASPAQAKTDLQALRNERPLTMNGERTPFSPAVEQVVQEIEKTGESVSVLSIYEAVKKLGKMSKSKEAVVRREAAQVGEILGDMLEQSPANNAQLGAARRAWRREAAQDTMLEWMKEKGIVATDRSGRKILNPGALKERFEREMQKPLFAKSFTASETQKFADFYDTLAKETPLMPSVKETRKVMAPGAGLTTPEVPVPTPETLPGGLADRPPGIGNPPKTTALPARPTPKDIPDEIPPPTSTHVPRVEKGAVPPEPPPVPQTRPVRGKTATGEDIPGETAAQYQQRVDEFNKARLGDRPKVLKPILGAGAVGAMAYTLQRMGVSPGVLDVGLYFGAGGIAANVVQKNANYFISKALLNPKYHDLMRAAIREDQTIDPLFYNVMLKIMTAEEKRDMPNELRHNQKKARR